MIDSFLPLDSLDDSEFIVIQHIHVYHYSSIPFFCQLYNFFDLMNMTKNFDGIEAKFFQNVNFTLSFTIFVNCNNPVCFHPSKTGYGRCGFRSKLNSKQTILNIEFGIVTTNYIHVHIYIPYFPSVMITF